jgi:hypothetical protein
MPAILLGSTPKQAGQSAGYSRGFLRVTPDGGQRLGAGVEVPQRQLPVMTAAEQGISTVQQDLKYSHLTGVSASGLVSKSHNASCPSCPQLSRRTRPSTSCPSYALYQQTMCLSQVETSPRQRLWAHQICTRDMQIRQEQCILPGGGADLGSPGVKGHAAHPGVVASKHLSRYYCKCGRTTCRRRRRPPRSGGPRPRPRSSAPPGCTAPPGRPPPLRR